MSVSSLLLGSIGSWRNHVKLSFYRVYTLIGQTRPEHNQNISPKYIFKEFTQMQVLSPSKHSIV